MFWPRCMAKKTKILNNKRQFKRASWTFRGRLISSKTGYRRGVVLPLNVPSHKQGGGKQVVSAVLHLSNPATSRAFETDRKWETDTDMWKQILSMVMTKYPTGQENKNTTKATSPLLNGNGPRRESVFLQTFLFFCLCSWRCGRNRNHKPLSWIRCTVRRSSLADQLNAEHHQNRQTSACDNRQRLGSTIVSFSPQF